MSERTFLRRYWQKHPLLVRGAFADIAAPLAPEDLFAVAGEPDALARLVQGRGLRFGVRTGPFPPGELARMPARDWTLLVQDCDKWFESAGAEIFSFVASSRTPIPCTYVRTAQRYP